MHPRLGGAAPPPLGQLAVHPRCGQGRGVVRGKQAVSGQVACSFISIFFVLDVI